jgi:hypothetical protein
VERIETICHQILSISSHTIYQKCHPITVCRPAVAAAAAAAAAASAAASAAATAAATKRRETSSGDRLQTCYDFSFA